jgi:hypothetical protein
LHVVIVVVIVCVVPAIYADAFFASSDAFAYQTKLDQIITFSMIPKAHKQFFAYKTHS